MSRAGSPTNLVPENAPGYLNDTNRSTDFRIQYLMESDRGGIERYSDAYLPKNDRLFSNVAPQDLWG